MSLPRELERNVRPACCMKEKPSLSLCAWDAAISMRLHSSRCRIFSARTLAAPASRKRDAFQRCCFSAPTRSTFASPYPLRAVPACIFRAFCGRLRNLFCRIVGSVISWVVIGSMDGRHGGKTALDGGTRSAGGGAAHTPLYHASPPPPQANMQQKP